MMTGGVSLNGRESSELRASHHLPWSVKDTGWPRRETAFQIVELFQQWYTWPFLE